MKREERKNQTQKLIIALFKHDCVPSVHLYIKCMNACNVPSRYICGHINNIIIIIFEYLNLLF